MRTNWLAAALLVTGTAAGCSNPAPTTSTPTGDPGQPPAAGADAAPSTGQALAPAADEAAPSATRGTAPRAPAGPVAPGAGAPRYADVTLAAGTELPLRLDSALASDQSAVEDPVRASLRRAIVVDERTVLPAGTSVAGIVTGVQRSAKVKGRASLAFRFTTLSFDDETYDIRTSSVTRRAQGTKRKDAAKIGIGAGAGAVIGGIVGGGKGAAVGTAVGAGTGTGVVLATRGDEVRLAAGTPVTVKLTEPLTVRVAIRPD